MSRPKKNAESESEARSFERYIRIALRIQDLQMIHRRLSQQLKTKGVR